jgi:porin
MLRAPIAFALLCAILARADEPAPALDFGLSITLEGSAGLSGGARRGEALHALTLGHIAWTAPTQAPDAARLRGYASILNHEGRGPTVRYLGDFLAASNIEAYDSTRVYSWWFQGEFADWSLRVGALLADEEFAGTTAGGNLNNSAFGWPAFISANTVNTGPAFYAAALGVRLARTVSPARTWRGGIYDGDTFDSAVRDPSINRHGLHYRLGGAQGAFLITELAYAPKGAATRLKLGAWHHTAKFADQQFDAAGRPFAVSGASPREHNGNTGAYATIEHTLAGTPTQPGHIDVFARLGAAPDDRNPLGWVLDTGVAWAGPLAGRPNDIAALGFVHAAFGSRAAATARLLDPAAPKLDAEQVLEANYTIHLSSRFSLKPGVQYIRHPGGNGSRPDAVVAMVRLSAEF